MKAFAAFTEKFSSKAMLNVAFAATTCVLGLLAWFGVDQIQQRSADVERIVVERTALLERKGELHASYRQTREQLLALQQMIQTLREKMPDTPEESQFLQQLSELAVNTGVSIGDFRPGRIASRANCQEIELRLRGTGPYAGICRWLASLSEMPRIVRIVQLTMVGPSTPGGECSIDIQLDMVFGLRAKQTFINQPLAGMVKP